MKNAIIWVVVIFAVAAGTWIIATNRAGDGAPPANDKPNGSLGDPNLDPPNDLGSLPVVGTQATSDEIVVESPKLGDSVGSPLKVTGRARGPWYFEASAPVTVYDQSGKVLGQGYVMAQDEWMTTEFVPFSGTITFNNPGTGGGAVVFMNDNPSGDASRAKYLAVPVFFD